MLVACEFSGVVRRAFRALGHDAWSCDLLPAEDGSPNHFQDDILQILKAPCALDWDLLIAHPPCTYLSNMSNCRIKEPGRLEKRQKALEFFLAIANAPIPKRCVENPRGFPERAYRPPDQIIQPWDFGHPESKATCLWLFNLPPLFSTIIDRPLRKWDGKRFRTFVDRLPSSSPKRSITFPGIAAAMAKQWGAL